TVGGVAASGTITDNDSQSVSSVLAEDAANAGGNPVDSSVVEGGNLRYTVALSVAAPAATEYTLGIGGTASAADYASISFSDGVAWKNGNPATGIIVVPAGVSGFAITVATADDAAIEVAESLTLTVGGVAATGTITDNDSLSVSSVLAEDAAHSGAIPVDDSVVEGASLLYSVVLNGSSPQAVEFSLAASGTAAVADYGSFSFSNGVAWKNGDPLSGVIVVPANVGSFTITVPTADDSQIEVAESLVLNVGGVSASGTLTDNDSQNVASVLAEDAANTGANPPDNSVVEGGSLRYSVTLTQASPLATEYAVSVSGTAIAADYGSFSFSNGVAWKNGNPASGILVVPANVASFAVTVPTVDDSAIELAESLTLVVGGVDASATISDNDSQSVASVTAQDAGHLGANDNTVEEGGALLYTVLLNSASPAATTYALSVHGTAAATADYGSFSFSNGVAWQEGNPASGILLVPANVSGFTITVPTVDDSTVESAESLILTVGGISAAGSIEDNDLVPTTPSKPPTGPIDAGLDPTSDNGSSNNDTVTSVITPEFTVRAEGYLQQGGSIRLMDPSGKQVGSNAISAADAGAGKINVQTGQLDDGVYTFRADIYDASGKLLGSAPVKVTVVTDVDGIAPSVELAANGGDFNRDGIADWQQHNVAQLPLASLAEFQAGRAAAASSFGAILAGSVGAANAAGAVQLTGNAQLADLSMSAAPAPLPAETQAASAMFNFSVQARPDSGPLPDLDSSRAGLQTRVVLDLAPGGVQANAYLKWNAQSQSWFNFVDDQRLDTFDDGATLLDLNGDGKADRVVLTLTDGGLGDEDGVANGVIVDPGMLAYQTAPEPPAAKPVFSVLLANGDRYYSADAAEAARMAQGESARLEGAYFDSLSTEAGGRAMLPSFQPFTSDWYFAAAGQNLPYACYIAQPGTGFQAAAAGAAGLTDFHLYQNPLGQTQLLSAAQAASLGLAAQGYVDRGAQFSSGTASAFAFDAEAYLVANRQDAGILALVGSLAQRFSSSSAAGFIEAVEQHYLGQVQLVGLPHGGVAGAAELNAAFGTHFNA
ncbi:choice-of-anchor U domain-containing protein, partial [Massilia sp. YIM B04103]|uniref:choice-of-anchor U domain-containing protein n=1 Tax=Massilia sp. YIM B04103 TaxID=2963106 RepID=UPI00210A654F